MTDTYTQNNSVSWGISTQLIDLGDAGPDGSNNINNNNNGSNSNSNNTSASTSVNTISSSLDMLLHPQSVGQTQPILPPPSSSSTSSSVLLGLPSHPSSYTEQLLDTSPMSTFPRTGSIPLVDAVSPSVAIVGETTPIVASNSRSTDFFDFFETGQSPSGGAAVLAGSFSNPFTSSYGLDMAAQAVPMVRAVSPEAQMQDPLTLLRGKSPVQPSTHAPTFDALPSTVDDLLVQISAPEKSSRLTQNEKCDLETLKSYLMTFKANSDKNTHYLKSKSKL